MRHPAVGPPAQRPSGAAGEAHWNTGTSSIPVVTMILPNRTMRSAVSLPTSWPPAAQPERQPPSQLQPCSGEGPGQWVRGQVNGRAGGRGHGAGGLGRRGNFKFKKGKFPSGGAGNGRQPLSLAGPKVSLPFTGVDYC